MTRVTCNKPAWLLHPGRRWRAPGLWASRARFCGGGLWGGGRGPAAASTPQWPVQSGGADHSLARSAVPCCCRPCVARALQRPALRSPVYPSPAASSRCKTAEDARQTSCSCRYCEASAQAWIPAPGQRPTRSVAGWEARNGTLHAHQACLWHCGAMEAAGSALLLAEVMPARMQCNPRAPLAAQVTALPADNEEYLGFRASTDLRGPYRCAGNSAEWPPTYAQTAP